MSDEANALLARAMRLTPAERAEVAARLGESVDLAIDGDRPVLGDGWKREIARRLEDFDAGREEAVDGDAAMEHVRNYRRA